MSSDERDQPPETFDRELVVEMLKMPAKPRAYVPAAARGRHPRRKKFTTIENAPLSRKSALLAPRTQAVQTMPCAEIGVEQTYFA